MNYEFGLWWEIFKTISNMLALLCLLDFLYDFHLEGNKQWGEMDESKRDVSYRCDY